MANLPLLEVVTAYDVCTAPTSNVLHARSGNGLMPAESRAKSVSVTGRPPERILHDIVVIASPSPETGKASCRDYAEILRRGSGKVGEGCG